MKFLIPIFFLCVPFPASGQTPATRVADLVGGKYVSGNIITGPPPAGYERFLVMWVDDPGICRRDVHVNLRENFLPDAAGRIAICGRVVFQGKNFPQGGSVADGKYLSYEFKDAHLIDLKGTPVRLEFITRTVEGVYYRFHGTYLEHQNATEGMYLEGNMTKFVNGQRVSENKLRFSRYVIME